MDIIALVIAAARGGQAWVGFFVTLLGDLLFLFGMAHGEGALVVFGVILILAGLALACALPGRDATSTRREGFRDRRLRMREERREREERRRDREEEQRREEERRGERMQAQQLHAALLSKLVAPQATASASDPPRELPPPIPSLGGDEPPPLPGEIQPAAWYVTVNGQKAGPYDINALLQLTFQKQINRNTLVWTRGMREWKRVSEMPELVQTIREAATRG